MPKGAIAEKKQKSTNDYQYEQQKEECTFKPNINKGVKQGKTNLSNVKGMERVMDRMNKAKEKDDTKKMWCERGIPAQKMAEVDKPDMRFTSKPTKFQTAFGHEGSQMGKGDISRQEYSVSQSSPLGRSQRRQEEASPEVA